MSQPATSLTGSPAEPPVGSRKRPAATQLQPHQPRQPPQPQPLPAAEARLLHKRRHAVAQWAEDFCSRCRAADNSTPQPQAALTEEWIRRVKVWALQPMQRAVAAHFGPTPHDKPPLLLDTYIFAELDRTLAALGATPAASLWQGATLRPYLMFENSLADFFERRVPALAGLPPAALLAELHRCWRSHCQFTEWLRRLLWRQDGPYSAAATLGRPTVILRSCELFVVKLLLPLQDPAVAAAAAGSGAAAAADAADAADATDIGRVERPALRSLMECMVIASEALRMARSPRLARRYSRLGEFLGAALREEGAVYRELMEAPVLEAVGRCYRAAAAAWLGECSVAAFLGHVEAAMVRERQRCDAYLGPTTWPRLQQVLLQALVAPFCEELLRRPQEGLVAALERGDTAAAVRLFRFAAQHTDSLEAFARVYVEWLEGRAKPLLLARRAAVAAAAAAQFKLKPKAKPGAKPGAKPKSEPKSAPTAATAAAAASAPPPATHQAGGGVGRQGGGAAPAGTAGPAAESAFITGLARLHARHVVEAMAPGAFHAAPPLQQQLHASWCDMLGRPELAAEEALANHLHRTLKPAAGVSEDAAAAAATAAISLYPYLPNKDVFRECYQRGLAARLLEGACRSTELETRLIQAMQFDTSAADQQRLRRMLIDHATATRCAAEHSQQWRGGTGPMAGWVERLEVLVLTNTCWPTSPLSTLSLRLPEPLAAGQRAFTAAYHALFGGKRKLSWLLHCGSVTVGYAGKQLVMRPLQAAVVLAFNAVPEGGHSLASLARLLALQLGRTGAGAGAKTSGPELELLKKLLHPLVDLKRGRLGLIHSSTGRVEAAAAFTVNPSFHSRLRRITVPCPNLESKRRMQADMAPQRMHTLQAVLVRIMKARRRLDHEALFAEAAQHVAGHFVLERRQFKREVASLLEREYLERAPDDRAAYVYCA